MSAVFKSYPLENDLEMAAVVLGGLPSSVVRRIGAFLGIRATKVGSIVKISEKTLDRRLKSGARLKPDESERMARLMRIISLAVSALESEDNARQWLQRPLRELRGQTPLQLAATEPGSREVERVLGRIEHGIFA
jgi:putative toxin-antitoxin system antitoxin component (TIGR02293 family)